MGRVNRSLIEDSPHMTLGTKPDVVASERTGRLSLADANLVVSESRPAADPVARLGWRAAAAAQLPAFGTFLAGNRNLSPELVQVQAQVMLPPTAVLIWISVFVMPSCILSYVYFARPERLFQATEITAA